MQQWYLLLFIAVLNLPTELAAQYGGKAFLPQGHAYELNPDRNSSASTRATLCGIDTIQYPLFKAFDASGPTQVDLFGIMDPGYSRLGQWFPAPDTVGFWGLDFFARVPGDTAPMNVRVYLAGPDSLPTGGPLVDINFFVPPDTSLVNYRLSLGAPVLIPDDYVLAIETSSNDSVFIACSEWTQGEGDREWLATAGATNFWQRGYDVLLDNQPFDGDVLLLPHVSYELDFDQSVDPTCLAPGREVQFRSQISPIFFSRFYNRSYNPYSAFFRPDSNFIWFFGDGDSSFLANPTHTYTLANPLPDSITVGLGGLMRGYSVLCQDVEFRTWEVGPAAEARFAVDDSSAADSFAFVFTGVADTWYWDFGDQSSPVFDEANPSHVYDRVGRYAVTLVASSCGTVDTARITLDVATADRASFPRSVRRVYPNPAQDHLYITLSRPSLKRPVRARLIDLQGRVVATTWLRPSPRQALDWTLPPLVDGMYYLELQARGVHTGTKVQIKNRL
jgi:hypothetical protein